MTETLRQRLFRKAAGFSPALRRLSFEQKHNRVFISDGEGKVLGVWREPVLPKEYSHAK